MAVSGDFDALEALGGALAAIGLGAFKRGVLPQLAEASVTEVRNGFRRAVDPYGVPWLPLRWRQGRPLRDTGRLGNSFAGSVTSDGFSVASNASYAAVHQGGAGFVRRGGATARTNSGRFASHSATGKRRAGAVRVAFGRTAPGAIPARPMVPDARGLPARWSAVFVEVANETMARIVRP